MPSRRPHTYRFALLALATAAVFAPSASARAGAPKNTLPPALSGAAVDGGTLQTSTGTWTGIQPISYSYQWRRCTAAGSGCSSISGATATSYAVTSADVGSTLSAVVTARNKAGTSTSRTTPSAVVAAEPPEDASPPALSGTPTAGQTLTASTGSWDGTKPLSYAFQWERCDAADGCAAITGATAASYAASSADLGYELRASVTATNAAGSAAADSDMSATVVAPPQGSPQPSGPTPPPAPGPWALTFHDEFDGTSLDLSKWRPNWLAGTDTAITKPINSAELSCYDPAQVSEGNGMLTLAAAQRACTANNGVTYQYASGAIESYNHYQFTYGYLEARMRVPVDASGTPVDWPAFWADGTGSWPTTGEIDVMEILGGGTFCWHFHYPYGAPGGCPTVGDHGGWHVFGADWEPGSITYYYDGIPVGLVTSGVTSAPMYLIANLGVSTQHGGPLSVPAQTDIDWIHVWQHA